MRIANEQERRFYEIEAKKQQWTFRQLQRQYGCSLYERLVFALVYHAIGTGKTIVSAASRLSRHAAIHTP